jgi:CubicO group peptidase (beta-lactamase class C family)
MNRHDDKPAAARHNRTPSRRQALQLLTAGAAGLTFGSRGALAQIAQGSNRPKPFDSALLDRAVEDARKFDQIHSLTIARAGEIAFAEAFRGPPLDRPVNVKSVSKSFVAALTGAAIERGVIEGIDQRLADAAPALVPANADPKVRDLTIAQFLTMQAGLKRTSGPNYGEWVKSRNWVAYALSQPFVAEPGERMLYSTGSYHVLGAILAKASGNSLLTLAREWIGDELDITIPPWARDPQGFYFGGNNMRLSPMAMLRFGEMHRQGGLSNGKQILRTDWIEKAWEPRTRSPFSGDAYGYGWFISQAGGRKFVYARGYGGQMIYIVPELELTVVITSDPTRPARSHGYAGQLRNLLTEEIMPAVV